LNEREKRVVVLFARPRVERVEPSNLKSNHDDASSSAPTWGRCDPCMLCFSGGFGARCVLRTRPMGSGTARRPGRTERTAEENGIIKKLIIPSCSRPNIESNTFDFQELFLSRSGLFSMPLTSHSHPLTELFLSRSGLSSIIPSRPSGAGHSTSRLPRPSPSKPYSNLKSENTPHQRPTTTGGQLGLA